MFIRHEIDLNAKYLFFINSLSYLLNLIIRQEPNQDILIGQFKEGKLDGAGISFSATEKYRTIYFGGWKHGKRDGVGAFIYPNDAQVIGYFRNNKIVRDNNFPAPIFIDSDGNQREYS